MDPSEQQILLLSTILQLEKRARSAKDLSELIFIINNETLKCIRYRQAILCRKQRSGKIRINAVSGVDRPDSHAPYIRFIKDLLQHLARQPDNRVIRPVSEADLDPKFIAGWKEWSCGYGVFCPLISPKEELVCWVLFLREKEWEESETAIFERLSSTYAHAWMAISGRSPWYGFLQVRWVRRIVQTGVLALLIWCLLLPVRLSVLAPVEIVPRKPFLVTSKMDGVIDTVPVQPNQGVKTNQLLFRLDDTVSRNNYEVTRKSLAVIEAEYKRARQKAFMDDESRARILYLKARIEQKSAEVAYLADVLKQGEVRAERDGIVVFSDVNDWLGKPVVTGEKVMSIADPGQVEAEVLLPVADAINLEPGADVLIFLNVAPDRPLLATLRQASYEAAITPEGVLSFRLKVTIDPGESVPRIGLRGTAKLYGKEVTVFYYLMRRPLIAIRQTLGV